MQRGVVLHMFDAMETDLHPQCLSLLEALTLWTEPALVAKLKMRERHYSPADLGSVIGKLTIQVIVPVVAGILLNKKLGWFAERYKIYLRYFDQFTILLIV